MSTTTLGTPLAEEAIRDINFFNGRLLTGSDLQREQAARQLADRRVGAALGAGVAYGLEVRAVTGGAPGRVQVQSGLGVAASGLVLHLATSPEVHLVAPPAQTTASVRAGFGPCGTLQGGTYVAGSGLFVLTLAPVTLAEGKAPVLAMEAVNTRCSTDAHVEAVQFRLLRVNDEALAPTADPTAVSLMRSRLARNCLLAQARAEAHAQPGTRPLPAGVLPGLAVPDLHRCELPLALLYMQGNAIIFVDRWAVRRRLAPEAASSAWAPWLGGRVEALAEAQLLQFQEHIVDTPNVLDTAATATLRWLPPAGFLPARLNGTQWRRFLADRAPAEEVTLAASDAPGVLAGALRGSAIDLQAPAASGRLRVYRVRGPGPGAGGELMFVRDARNVHHAQQVWVDGRAAGLPGAEDVQAALATLRAGSCLQVVLRPDMDCASVLAQLPVGRDVTVCFEPGEYRSDGPLKVGGLGRLQVQGHGALLRNTKGECALYLTRCAAVQVHQLQVEGSRGRQGQGAEGLNGALTVVDTPDVQLCQVLAISAPGEGSGEGLRASALRLEVQDQALGELPPPRFQVSDCELRVATGQLGLLVLNGDHVTIQRNRVRALDSKKALQRGIVVAGRQAGHVQIEGNHVSEAVQGIAVGVSEHAPREAEALKAGWVAVMHNRVEVRVPGEAQGNRFGISIGNAQSVQVQANHTKLTGDNPQDLPLDGLRLHGLYGPHIVVRDNLFEALHHGIAFNTTQSLDKGLWAFQCNVGRSLRGQLLNGVPPVSDNLFVVQHNREAA